MEKIYNLIVAPYMGHISIIADYSARLSLVKKEVDPKCWTVLGLI